MTGRSLKKYLARCARRGERVLPFFPHVFRKGDDVPQKLERATIVRIGTTKDREFLIEYEPLDKSCIRRLVLGFGDRGIWIEQNKPIKFPTVAGDVK